MYFEVEFAGPILMTVDESQPVKLIIDYEVIPMRFVADIVTSTTRTCRQIERPQIKINYLETLHKLQIGLLPNTMPIKETLSAPVVPILRPTSENSVETLCNTVSQWQSVAISLQTKIKNHIEESCIPVHESEHQNLRPSHNWSITE